MVECSEKCKVASFEKEGRGHEPRNVGSLWKRGKAGKWTDSPQELQERNAGLLTPIF